MNYLQMRSPLAKAKNLGASGTGTHHWWHQRLTSIIMIPLVIWLCYFLHSIAGDSVPEALIVLRRPYNVIPMMLVVIALFYHASLGMQVVIEDYISNLTFRYFLIIALEIFVIVTVLSAVVALLFLMLV
jgi:succinate dehydrogenase / fumarate reductase membrane anchor subunit